MSAAVRIWATVRAVPALCDHVGHEYGVEVLSGQPIVQPSFAPFAVVEKRPERSFRTMQKKSLLTGAQEAAPAVMKPAPVLPGEMALASLAPGDAALAKLMGDHPLVASVIESAGSGPPSGATGSFSSADGSMGRPRIGPPHRR